MTSEASPGKGARTRRSRQSSSNGSGSRLVIVESPAKARTIARFLGPEYVVESSIGHIRDLPSSAAEVPQQYKKESWGRLGVNVDRDFEPIYVIPPGKKQQVAKLRQLLKDADELYLATDEDREGEAIAWHLREVLKPRVPVRRMVFHEITRLAIEDAIASPREIDESLVEAQEARRILDRLFGYEVSPVLWKKVRPRLSAGRVQSAAVRLIVDRERQRMRFVPASFWDVEAEARTREGGRETVGARLVELDGRRVAGGRDFDPETGRLASEARLLDHETAESVATSLATAEYEITEVVERPYTQRPPAPFITSTLQQEAGRKLRFGSQRTMQVAQSLYENGYITYMRTDSTALSSQAVNAARQQVRDLYGDQYLTPEPRQHLAKSRGAQEAHEAIRPAGDVFRMPDSLGGQLSGDELRLYDLIWKRTVASQMRDASGLRTNVRLRAQAGEHGIATLSLSGKVITFPGFLRAYVEGSDDPEAELEDQERLIPALREGQHLDGVSAQARGHETQAPGRYTEAALVQELEERGIGRPSTYASIIQTVQDRGYVWKRGTSLIPTFTAFAVVNLLERHFPDLVDLDFTARMEDDLDSVASGEIEPVPWLRRFYFGDPGSPPGAVEHSIATEGLRDRIGSGWEEIDAREVSSILLGTDGEGRTIAVRVGRYGPYVQAGDEPVRANIPDDLPPDELTVARAIELLQQAAMGDRPMTADPATGKQVYLKTGRYGPYVQLGEDDDNGGKPKRSSLWPPMTMETLTPEQALMLLSYPRSLGVHPATGIEITAQDGPNGPYLRMGEDSRSLEGHDQLQSVTLDEAMRLFAQPKPSRRRGLAVLATLGKHPDSEAPIELRSGRFGPYVTDGVVNASVPRGRDPNSVTLDQAIDLITQREDRLRSEGKDPRAPAAARSRARRTTRTTRRPQRKSA